MLVQPYVYAVADGMGGHAAGDRASAIVVDELAALAGLDVAADDVTRVLQAANSRVRRLSADAPAGTTVTGVIGVEQDGAAYWLVINLGDSRVYRLVDGRLTQLSVDHSVVQELLDSGRLDVAQARRHPQRHVVTRAVGGPEALEPDYWLVPSLAGERLLVCSDGLTVELEDHELCALLQENPEAQDAADALVARALASGGRDNVTVVVIDVDVRPGEATTEVTVPRATTPVDGDTLPRQEVQVL